MKWFNRHKVPSKKTIKIQDKYRPSGTIILTNNSPLKIAVVAHIFYKDIAEEILGYLDNIHHDLDMYVSTRPEMKDHVEAILKNKKHIKKAVVYGIENKGFDIGPFLSGPVSDYYKYDIICKIHSKKNTTGSPLDGWQEYLLKNVMGSEKIVREIMDLFHDDGSLGILYPETFPAAIELIGNERWGKNWRTCERLSKMIGLDTTHDMEFDFPSGSIFWFRPKALKPLFDLGLKMDDFEVSRGDIDDGTLAHAIERFFVLAAAKEGFRHKKVLFTC